MKILKILRGFITNSSSTNYWLDDDVLEKGEIKIQQSQKITAESSTKEINKEQNNYKSELVKEPLTGLIVCFSFSLILLIVLLIKFFKREKP